MVKILKERGLGAYCTWCLVEEGGRGGVLIGRGGEGLEKAEHGTCEGRYYRWRQEVSWR